MSPPYQHRPPSAGLRDVLHSDRDSLSAAPPTAPPGGSKAILPPWNQCRPRSMTSSTWELRRRGPRRCSNDDGGDDLGGGDHNGSGNGGDACGGGAPVCRIVPLLTLPAPMLAARGRPGEHSSAAPAAANAAARWPQLHPPCPPRWHAYMQRRPVRPPPSRGLLYLLFLAAAAALVFGVGTAAADTLVSRFCFFLFFFFHSLQKQKQKETWNSQPLQKHA